MLVSVLPVPFGDAGRQRQYEAVRAALEAEADAPATVLLGNPGTFSPIQADMLVVRPTGVALGVLTPQAGQLTLPALQYGPWQLDGQPLLGGAGSDNPFAQYQQQLPVAMAWLGEHFGLPADEMPLCAGFALFAAPLTFGPEVEAQLHRATHDFQLVGGAAQLPARLRQQLAAEPFLDANELLEWGEWLASEPYVAHNNGVAESWSLAEGLFGNPANFLEQKLRQLWRWLGAEDIPADPPYGAPPPADQHLRDQQEQARLQQLRQELQAELHQQRQEAAAREAARTQELRLLRQQLAQAGPSATEREAEQRAKAALEESLRTARAELATRNSELDARIQQLGQLIGQLQAGPGALVPTAAGLPASARLPGPATAAPAVPATAPKPRSAAPRRSFRRRQAERWGVVALVLAGVGAGTWGVVRWAQHPAPRPAATIARRAQPAEDVDAIEENQSADQDEQADSLARMQAATIDTLTTRSPEPAPVAAESEPASTTDMEATPSETLAPQATPASTETSAPTTPSTTTEPTPNSPDPAAPEPSPAP